MLKSLLPKSKTPNAETSEMLQAIARGSEALCVSKGWPGGLNILTSELGKAAGAHRVWVSQVIDQTDDCIDQDYIFEWAASPEYAQLDKDEFSMFRKPLDSFEYRELVDSRHRGDWQAIITDKLPQCLLREDLERQSIVSMLSMPIHVDGKWWGTIGFDSCAQGRHWTEDDIALLRTASSLISSALVRERLNSGYQQFSIFQEITDSAAWSLDLKRGRFRFSGGLIQDALPRSQYILNHFDALFRRVHPNDRRNFIKSLRKFYASGERLYRYDLRFLDDRSRYRWIEIIGQLTRDELNIPAKLAGIAIDIRTRKKVELDLRDRAHIDPLTGAANCWTFDEQLKHLITEAHEDDKLFSLVMFDLDHFKKVNDTHGHLVGDRVLQAVTAICRENLREIDLLARLGGEEFALLLPGAGPSQSASVAERIRTSVACKPVATNIAVTVSFGSATYDPKQPVPPKTLLNWADEALYAAKRQGRNCLVIAADTV